MTFLRSGAGLVPEFPSPVESSDIVDLKRFEQVAAVILIGALMVVGVFPRLLSDNANRELEKISSYNSQSKLSVAEDNGVDLIKAAEDRKGGLN